jgi:tol-pal system protein YbgF
MVELDAVAGVRDLEQEDLGPAQVHVEFPGRLAGFHDAGIEEELAIGDDAKDHRAGAVGRIIQADKGRETFGAAGQVKPKRAFGMRADAALDLFKRGDYQGSIAGFGSFVKNYPRSPLASSAQYWIGNAQYARRDYRASIVTQRQLLKEFPDSSKAPDALLNIASAQADMGDNAAARRTLEELIARYPKSDAGTRARQRLGVR